MWFKKKQKDNDNNSTWIGVPSTDELKKEIEKLQESNKALNDGFSKLQRIVKYSGNESTYHLDRNIRYSMFLPIERKYTLYIYVDKEEYVVELEELENERIDEERCEFRIEDKFAYFNISSISNMGGNDYGEWSRHEFIIDFNNGKYVHSSKYDEELNAKENVEEIAE